MNYCICQLCEVKQKKLAVLLMVDTNREGNQADVDRLMPLLPTWGYDEVIKPQNPTKRDMIQSLQKLQKYKGTYHVTNIHTFDRNRSINKLKKGMKQIQT